MTAVGSGLARTDAVKEPPDAFVGWVSGETASRSENFQGYVYGIAQARYVIRKVFRIVDEEAKKAGLDPLAHQALLQVFGALEEDLTINGLADRLDIAPAFASRLVKELETKGYARRVRSLEDRRVTYVEITPEGEQLLRAIDHEVHVHVEYFQKQLGDDRRYPALAIFAFYLGIGQESTTGAAILLSALGHDSG
jgi:DNA-binding MarR family transcriptional regulator